MSNQERKGPGGFKMGRGAAFLQALEQHQMRRPGQQPQSLAQQQPPPHPKPPQTSIKPSSEISESSEPAQSVPRPAMGRGMLIQKLLQSAPSAGTLTSPIASMSIQPKVLLPSSPPTKTPSSPPAKVPLPPSPPAKVPLPPSPTEVKGSSPPSSKISVIPAVGKEGSSGKSIPLGANYLVIQHATDHVFQYVVTYNPPVESKNMRYAMLNEHKDLIGNTRAFDGSILFLPIKVTDTTVTRSSKRATDGVMVKISITLTNMLLYEECIQLFNIIIRRVLRTLDMQQVGRHYFDKHHPISVPQHKMELWPGYVTSIHEFDGGLLLLLDISHKLLRTDTALDFFAELYANHRNTFRDEATRQLVGSVVMTRYNNKTYRVDDICWDKNPQSTFTNHTGRSISFIEYYKTAYGINIKDIEQPLLLHRPKVNHIVKRKEKKDSPNEGQDVEEEGEKVICLIPELCSMTGLTDNARNDFRVMKDLAVHTRVSPNQRENSIKKFIQAVNENPKAREELLSWGLSIRSSILETTGRTLPQEDILFRQQKVKSGMEADWGRSVVKETVITAVSLNNWILVFTKRDADKARNFMTMMKKACPPMGIDVVDASFIELPNDRTESFIKAVRSRINSSLQLVVVIFPSPRDDRYSSIKKLCCIESPVPSQVINARTISQQQKLRSVTQKIALQINVKLGGELWALEIPLKNVMVIGIDVFHDNARGRRSVLGFVSSTNKTFTRWFSRVTIQDMNQEIGDGLKICFQNALSKYHELNNTLPDRIIIYRDGVGDGQMNMVYDFEVPQLKNCLVMFGENYSPKMGVVIVQKRISTRLFSHGHQGYDNPSPGTILDHTVTRKRKYDFFLVSQHVRQGTVTPTHYNIIYDTSGLKPDHMQRLTYKLTHLYYNWPGTIRVPAPCQYAHKLAFLVGQSLHSEPRNSLCDRLFFL